MQRSLLLLLFLCGLLNYTHAQTPQLIGFSENGGKFEGGVFFRLRPDDTTGTLTIDFPKTIMNDPGFSVVPWQGYLYGVTNTGGRYNQGMLFSYKLSSRIFKVLVDFQDTITGKNPANYPISYSYINYGYRLYGGADGGKHGSGTSWSFNLDYPELSVRHISPSDEINVPMHSEMTAEGHYFGNTGADGLGGMVHDHAYMNDRVLYRFDSSTHEMSGITSLGDTVFMTCRKVYNNYNGALCRWDPVKYFQVLQYYKNDEQVVPHDNPILRNNKVYNVTNRLGGGGFLNVFDLSAGEATRLATLSGDNFHRLSRILLADGKFFGVGFAADSTGTAVIYKINTDGSGLQELLVLDKSQAPDTTAYLTYDSGTFYWLHNEAGAATVYSWSATGGIKRILRSNHYPVVGHPVGQPVEISKTYYGAASSGGDNDLGGIFFANPSSKSIVRILAFSESTVSEPVGGLSYLNYQLYGLAAKAGLAGRGGVYIYNTSLGHLDTVIALPAGYAPAPGAALVSWQKSLFFPAVPTEGSGKGALMEFDTQTRQLKVLQELGCTPSALTQHNGLVYGICSGEAQQVFTWDPASGTISWTAPANALTGTEYSPAMAFAGSSAYGVSSGGGLHNGGTLYRFSEGKLEEMLSFDQSTGTRPRANPVYLDGKLYGMNSAGGEFGFGTFYAFDPLTETLEVFPLNERGIRNPGAGGLFDPLSEFTAISDHYNMPDWTYSCENGQLTVKTEALRKVEVLDLAGRRIAGGTSNTQIPLTPGGVAILRVEFGEGMYSTKKIFIR